MILATFDRLQHVSVLSFYQRRCPFFQCLPPAAAAAAVLLVDAALNCLFNAAACSSS
jgi:hypothetical protein